MKIESQYLHVNVDLKIEVNLFVITPLIMVNIFLNDEGKLDFETDLADISSITYAGIEQDTKKWVEIKKFQNSMGFDLETYMSEEIDSRITLADVYRLKTQAFIKLDK